MTRYDGSKKKRRIKKLRISETSPVDVPAQGPALIAITKRAAEPVVKNRMALTTQNGGHAHSITMVRANDSGLAELRSGQTTWVHDDDAGAHQHDWVMDDAGNIIIADANGHTHGLSVLVKSAADLPPELAALEGEARKGDTSTVTPAADDHGTETPSSEDNMTEKNDNAGQNDAVQGQLDELQKSNERLAKVVALSPEQRTHFDTLKADGQDEFLAAEDKDAIVKNAADSDPVVYTTVSGREIRKSAGPDTLALAQELDIEKRENAANRLVQKRADFVKRAGEQFGNLNGDSDVKGDLMEAVESLPTEKQGAVKEMLKAHDAGIAKAMETIGTSDSGSANAEVTTKNAADAEIRKIAVKLQEQDGNLSDAQAYVKALETPEGQKLHSQLIG